MKSNFLLLFLFFNIILCENLHGQKNITPLFTEVSPSFSGITFQNNLVETPQHNVANYHHFYNGGGVATGDFNNDGLIDIYLTSNQLPNKLYLNKGHFKFEDITKNAGVEGRQGWKTGVSVADVNGDGLLDIYVCYSGDDIAEKRANQLFINNGNLTFTDRAKEMGVADIGYTTNAAFFDYDNDGDLDLFVLNHNIKIVSNYFDTFIKNVPDLLAGNHLYKNNNGHFEDVTQIAGIVSNTLSYGLAISIADINNDGWPDIYVGNDYVEEDYLYLNNKDGTFTELLKSVVGHMSHSTMGVDIADLNNDQLPDMYTLDMLPKDNKRQKLLFSTDNYEYYNNVVKSGYYHQITRNNFQLNNGDGTFSEIGQLAGISNTDWSWSPLIADFDNDGKKDIFVTNGFRRDITNMDFIKYYVDALVKEAKGNKEQKMFEMLKGVKVTPLHNYIFKNNGNLTFTDNSKDWGFTKLGFSNGAAYADLDNDGDLDIIINRINQTAGIYKNNTVEKKIGGNYLKIKLSSHTKNTNAIGARVTLFSSSGKYMIENYPIHGFQSSMQVPLHFSFPDTKVDSIKIKWPNTNETLIKSNIKINTLLNVSDSISHTLPNTTEQTYNQPIFTTTFPAIFYTHSEDAVNDFKIQALLPKMISYSGPKFVRGDINGDDLEDLYVCGTSTQPGSVYLQTKEGKFLINRDNDFSKFSIQNETNGVFIDVDNDGDLDLFVLTGDYQRTNVDSLPNAKLYINEKGYFKLSNDLLQKDICMGSVALSIDVNKDGFMDLFIGGNVVPGRYPESPGSMILINDGKGRFTNETKKYAPDFLQLGMVTDAKWVDINKNNKPVLLISGEWMPLQCFELVNNQFVNKTDTYFDKKLNGLWNKMELVDIDKDGDLDLIAGNWGTNSQLQASEKEPMNMYYDDFDKNGFIDPIICQYNEGVSYPMATRDEMTDQIVSLRQKFPNYESYSTATINEILTPTQIDQAKKVKVNYLHTTWFENINGKFVTRSLPIQSDFSPVYSICASDFNGDGKIDLLLCGNIENNRIRIGKIDANYGVLMLGDGKGNFKYINQVESGLSIRGSVRDILKIDTKSGNHFILIGINNNKPVTLKY
jgi:hypothetical protein